MTDKSNVHFGKHDDESQKVAQPREQRKSIIKDSKRLGGDKLSVIVSSDDVDAKEKISIKSATSQGKPIDKVTANADTATQSAANVDTEKSIVYPVEGKPSKTNVGEGYSKVYEKKQTLVSPAKKEEQIKAKVSKEYKKTGDVKTLTGKSGGMSGGKKKYPELQGTTQWEALMRKFSQAHKETCKTVPTELQTAPRSKKQFPTGSTYAGSWNQIGMSGYGTFEFPHQGVIYEGEFDDGMFHGEGELRYACGAIMKGKWDNGKIIEKHLTFPDGLEYEEQGWNYLRYPDRRYTIEYDEGLEPAPLTYKTADQPPPLIPPGYYDVGEGFYNPETKTVYKYNDLTAIVRSPEEREQEWILNNCRTTPEYPLGPGPCLYEKWTEPTLEAEVPPPAAACTKTFPGEEPEGDPSPDSNRQSSKLIEIKSYDSGRRLTSSTTDVYKPAESSESTLRRHTSTGSTGRLSRCSAGIRLRSVIQPIDLNKIKGINEHTTLASQSVTENTAPVSRTFRYSITYEHIPQPKSVINW